MDNTVFIVFIFSFGRDPQVCFVVTPRQLGSGYTFLLFTNYPQS
jgi:hypothetical protein